MTTTPPPDHHRDGVESKAGGRGANEAVERKNRAGVGQAKSRAGEGAERWASSNGKGKGAMAAATTATAAVTAAAAAAVAEKAASTGPDKPRTSPRRVGTYERERQQRCSVLHYLTLATTPQPLEAAASPADSAELGAAAATAADAAQDAASPSPPTSATTHPDGATAAALLATMRERPWEGRPSTGTVQDWAEWLEHLDPTLERHLRWLVVDGLAVQSNRDRDRGKEARFVAVHPLPTSQPQPQPQPPHFEKENEGEEETVEPGGQASAGRLATPVTGGKAATAGGAAGPGADILAAGSSMLAGGVRIMKSRPIKMVKPWR